MRESFPDRYRWCGRAPTLFPCQIGAFCLLLLPSGSDVIRRVRVLSVAYTETDYLHAVYNDFPLFTFRLEHFDIE